MTLGDRRKIEKWWKRKNITRYFESLQLIHTWWYSAKLSGPELIFILIIDKEPIIKNWYLPDFLACRWHFSHCERWLVTPSIWSLEVKPIMQGQHFNTENYPVMPTMGRLRNPGWHELTCSSDPAWSLSPWRSLQISTGRALLQCHSPVLPNSFSLPCYHLLFFL